MADSLAGLQDAIEAFVAERDWAQFHTPKNLAMGVAIEAAEIMEHFLWCSGEESRALTPQKRAEVANEIGDVLIYLLRLSRTLDIDAVAAARGQARAQPREVSGREGQGTRDEVRRPRLTDSRMRLDAVSGRRRRCRRRVSAAPRARRRIRCRC